MVPRARSVYYRFFQMLSISNTLREMRAEIDSIKEVTAVHSAEEPAVSARGPVVKAAEPTEAPLQTPTQPTVLMVSEVISLYPESNYHTGAVGNAFPGSDITLLSRKTVEGTQWVKVQLANGDIGWAPYEFFSEISATETGGAEENTEDYR